MRVAVLAHFACPAVSLGMVLLLKVLCLGREQHPEGSSARNVGFAGNRGHVFVLCHYSLLCLSLCTDPQGSQIATSRASKIFSRRLSKIQGVPPIASCSRRVRQLFQASSPTAFFQRRFYLLVFKSQETFLKHLIVFKVAAFLLNNELTPVASLGRISAECEL